MAVWDRQTGESTKAYAAFATYRDLGPSGRSIAKAAQALGKHKVTLEAWSRKWSWVARVEAWDDENERLLRREQDQARKEMCERHAKLGTLFQNKIVQRLMAFSEADLAGMTPRDLAYWLDIGVKVERLARGEPTAEVRNRLAGARGEPAINVTVGGDGSNSADDAASILAILAAAGVIPAAPADGDGAQADEVHTAEANA